jgi:hypothetical protein
MIKIAFQNPDGNSGKVNSYCSGIKQQRLIEELLGNRAVAR